VIVAAWVVLMLSLGGEDEEELELFLRPWATQLRAIVKDEFGLGLELPPKSVKVIHHLDALLREGPEQKSARLLRELVAQGQPECHFERVLVSYRAWLVRYAEWGLAETSKSFQYWKKRIDKVHLVEMSCRDGEELLIESSYGGSLMLSAWRFFPREEWRLVEPKLARLAAIAE
jgi:hypothetical protein